jgi:Protein of unknown function (DUF1036)
MYSSSKGYCVPLFVALVWLHASNARGGDLSFIEGEWNNHGGDNIRIVEDSLGGWDAWLGAAGEGRIRNSTYRGGNIVVEAKDLRCWFRATVLNGNATMNWKLIDDQGDCNSLTGYFTRLEQPIPMFDFTACDGASYSIQIATIGKRSSAPTVFMKEGWFTVNPGECKNLGSFRSGNFYYYAHAYGDEYRQWPGGFET